MLTTTVCIRFSAALPVMPGDRTRRDDGSDAAKFMPMALEAGSEEVGRIAASGLPPRRADADL
ncbi:hypothetical protein WGT02_08625 [Rhizobium sp. T1470]|uniref:hypothetical protein n=1 Tax=unclassified Rhizobium TaxID=2613769 RepID=UPI001AAFED66|nr:hypothetical protein [Rhizobium sp. T1473]MCA0801338.1 hypothetical protein [Rhizobium sp. T1473]